MFLLPNNIYGKMKLSISQTYPVTVIYATQCIVIYNFLKKKNKKNNIKNTYKYN